MDATAERATAAAAAATAAPLHADVDDHEDELDPFCLDLPPGRRILWDYIILDEGHKIKNSRTQVCRSTHVQVPACLLWVDALLLPTL